MAKSLDGRLAALEKWTDDRLAELCHRAVAGFALTLSEEQLTELAALQPGAVPPAWARAWLEEFVAADAERYAAACAFDRMLSARDGMHEHAAA